MRRHGLLVVEFARERCLVREIARLHSVGISGPHPRVGQTRWHPWRHRHLRMMRHVHRRSLSVGKELNCIRRPTRKIDACRGIRSVVLEEGLMRIRDAGMGMGEWLLLYNEGWQWLAWSIKSRWRWVI